MFVEGSPRIWERFSRIEGGSVNFVRVRGVCLSDSAGWGISVDRLGRSGVGEISEYSSKVGLDLLLLV